MPRSRPSAVSDSTTVYITSMPFSRAASMIFAMFGDAEQPWDHVRLLARLARLTATPEARDRLRSAQTDDALRTAIQAEDDAHG